MRAGAAVVVVLLLMGGCFAAERDASIYYVWAKRGAAMGDLAHLYCSQAGVRERQVFLHALGDYGRVKVIIQCVTDGS